MRIAIAALILVFGAILPASAQGFCFKSPGVLVPPRSGEGRQGDRTVYIPNLKFPIAVGPKDNLHAYCNSQVYGIGGNLSKIPGDVNSPKNYQYCWADNYCEARSWAMPMCAKGSGHQGLDCRPNAPKKAVFEALSFANGRVTQVTKNTTVAVRADDGTECRYLHMAPETIKVKRGDRVKAGDVLGKISNIMGGKPNTSIHLHFDCTQVIAHNGKTRRLFIPILASMAHAYAKEWGLDVPVADGKLQKSKHER